MSTPLTAKQLACKLLNEPDEHNLDNWQAVRALTRELEEWLESNKPKIGGETSDGYHTFNELYDHRCTLFLALMASHPEKSWVSKKHGDGSEWAGWFIAGMRLTTGDVTYHIPVKLWDIARKTGAAVVDFAPAWDGHTPANVVERIQTWIPEGCK